MQFLPLISNMTSKINNNQNYDPTSHLKIAKKTKKLHNLPILFYFKLNNKFGSNAQYFNAKGLKNVPKSTN